MSFVPLSATQSEVRDNNDDRDFCWVAHVERTKIFLFSLFTLQCLLAHISI